jgi:hypothetical protein
MDLGAETNGSAWLLPAQRWSECLLPFSHYFLVMEMSLGKAQDQYNMVGATKLRTVTAMK